MFAIRLVYCHRIDCHQRADKALKTPIGQLTFCKLKVITALFVFCVSKPTISNIKRIREYFVLTVIELEDKHAS